MENGIFLERPVRGQEVKKSNPLARGDRIFYSYCVIVQQEDKKVGVNLWLSAVYFPTD